MTDVWLDKARGLAPVVEKHRDEAEQQRHLSTPVADAMRDAGLYGMLVSKAFGGSQASLESAVRVVEELSRQDGATGWNATIGIGGALMADYLPEEHARTVFGDGPAAGSFGGTGKAVPVEGGYRVSGRWGFASGCHNAPWFAAGCPIFDDGTMRTLPSGAPDIQIMFMPASECRIIDTWTSVGLRGTGSHDIEAADVFVHAGRHVSLMGMRQPAPERK
jgi:alkylation response protein AidB-like acyl-CoA dehydrogenase